MKSSKNKEIVKPRHIAFILDGNRRWAKERGLPKLVGHQKGFLRAKEIISHADKQGLEAITLYCFSKENWKRDNEEVNYLMRIFQNMIDKNIERFHLKKLVIKHIGDKDGLPVALVNSLKRAESLTRMNSGMIVQIAINYTGRDEIARALNKIISLKRKPNEELISENLDTSGTVDPDLIVRTSGEQRLSGFLLWQASYAELYFPKVHWPDFDKNEFDKAIREFAKRQRRFGGN